MHSTGQRHAAVAPKFPYLSILSYFGFYRQSGSRPRCNFRNQLGSTKVQGKSDHSYRTPGGEEGSRRHSIASAKNALIWPGVHLFYDSPYNSAYNIVIVPMQPQMGPIMASSSDGETALVELIPDGTGAGPLLDQLRASAFV